MQMSHFFDIYKFKEVYTLEGMKVIRKHKDEIIRRYLSGESSYKLAAEFNTFTSYIKRLLEEDNLSLRPLSIKRNVPISSDLREIIDGWLLGDGNISISGTQACFCFVTQHKEYIKYVDNLLNIERRKE